MRLIQPGRIEGQAGQPLREDQQRRQPDGRADGRNAQTQVAQVRFGRRLGVAQAYLRRPGLLLLDEPTEGLDRETARALLANLRSALPGTTIVAAIHDRTLDHLPVPADATVRLAAGRVVGGLRGPVPER